VNGSARWRRTSEAESRKVLWSAATRASSPPFRRRGRVRWKVPAPQRRHDLRPPAPADEPTTPAAKARDFRTALMAKAITSESSHLRRRLRQLPPARVGTMHQTLEHRPVARLGRGGSGGGGAIPLDAHLPPIRNLRNGAKAARSGQHPPRVGGPGPGLHPRHGDSSWERYAVL